jgi:hypothetical protein
MMNLEDAREFYFGLGLMESDIGPRENPLWYWRRAAKYLAYRVDTLEEKLENAARGFKSLRDTAEECKLSARDEP